MDARRTSEPIVSVSGAGVKRGGRWLVEDIDLTIRRGEIVTLIGPNGSGKSTTAKMVTGVLKPDVGSVALAPKLTIGYVPQKLNIDWTLPLTVKRLMTLTGRHSADAVAGAFDAVGITHLANDEVQHLSGGEFQRALLSCAMIRRPDLLVLDEPVQGVDFSGERSEERRVGKECRSRWAAGRERETGRSIRHIKGEE